METTPQIHPCIIYKAIAFSKIRLTILILWFYDLLHSYSLIIFTAFWTPYSFIIGKAGSIIFYLFWHGEVKSITETCSSRPKIKRGWLMKFQKGVVGLDTEREVQTGIKSTMWSTLYLPMHLLSITSIAYIQPYPSLASWLYKPMRTTKRIRFLIAHV